MQLFSYCLNNLCSDQSAFLVRLDLFSLCLDVTFFYNVSGKLLLFSGFCCDYFALCSGIYIKIILVDVDVDLFNFCANLKECYEKIAE